MDYKFLHKVVSQIVSETMIDYRGKGKIFTPFSLPFYLFLPFYPSFSSISSSYRSNFFNHCKEVNEQEIEYVWEEYKQIIIDKINNGL